MVPRASPLSKPRLRMCLHNCGVCGDPYNNLSQHWGRSPECRPPEFATPDSSDDEDYSMASSVAERVSVDCRLEEIAHDLADLRFEHGLNSQAIEFVKTVVEKWVRGVAAQTAHALKPLVREGVTKPDILAAMEVELFANLHTHKQELAYMKLNSPYMEPRVVDVGNKVCMPLPSVSPSPLLPSIPARAVS